MHDHDHDNGKKDLTVMVFEPSRPEPKEFTWARSMKVGDAAAEAAAAFGVGGTPSLQNSEGEILDPKKPLVAVGVRDGDELNLVSAGGGV